jgi:multiple sugar transport system ATP-binding protein
LKNCCTANPIELSGGQRQRVAMGRAIVRKPSVFLFDEPLSNLDAKLRTQMRTEIKRLHQKVQSTIIYVTHDQVEAMTLADRIVVMRDGSIEQVGPAHGAVSESDQHLRGWLYRQPPHEPGARPNCQRRREHPEDPVQRPAQRTRPRQGRYVDQPEETDVIMGLRTEDFTVDNGNVGFPDEWKVEGVVEVVEPLGGETHMHMDFNGRFLHRQKRRPQSLSRLVSSCAWP